MGKMFSSFSNTKGGDNPIVWCLCDWHSLNTLNEPQKESITYPKSLVSVRVGVWAQICLTEKSVFWIIEKKITKGGSTYKIKKLYKKFYFNLHQRLFISQE